MFYCGKEIVYQGEQTVALIYNFNMASIHIKNAPLVLYEGKIFLLVSIHIKNPPFVLYEGVKFLFGLAILMEVYSKGF